MFHQLMYLLLYFYFILMHQNLIILFLILIQIYLLQFQIYYIFINNQNGSKIIMEEILKEIDKVRQKLKKGPADTLLLQKPFAQGMYRFSMFMIGYYSRVKDNLKLDYV